MTDELGRPIGSATPQGQGSAVFGVWAAAVDDAKVRAAADFLVSTGPAAQGFQYINIDDTSEGKRDDKGVLQPNEKFPNMKALAD